MDLILDTCGFLSLVGLAKRKLTGKTLSAIESATKLYVSASSLFEISIKHKKGNLPISPYQTPLDLWETAVKEYQLEEIAVSAKTFSEAVGLPEVHADPFDRIIIAEALARKIPIVTYDAIFSGYGVKTVS